MKVLLKILSLFGYSETHLLRKSSYMQLTKTMVCRLPVLKLCEFIKNMPTECLEFLFQNLFMKLKLFVMRRNNNKLLKCLPAIKKTIRILMDPLEHISIKIIERDLSKF